MRYTPEEKFLLENEPIVIRNYKEVLEVKRRLEPRIKEAFDKKDIIGTVRLELELDQYTKRLPYLKGELAKIQLLKPITESIDGKVDIAKRYPIRSLLGLDSRTHAIKCPFHTEDTPSCHVYDDTNSYYCFGCGKGGDVIDLTMHIHNLCFKDAVKYLAKLS